MEPQEIKKLMTEVMEEQHEKFWVSAETHYLDHQQMKDCRTHKEEWMDNHEFVSGIRRTKATVESTGLKVFVVAVCTSILGFLGWLFDVFTFKIGG